MLLLLLLLLFSGYHHHCYKYVYPHRHRHAKFLLISLCSWTPPVRCVIALRFYLEKLSLRMGSRVGNTPSLSPRASAFGRRLGNPPPGASFIGTSNVDDAEGRCYVSPSLSGPDEHKSFVMTDRCRGDPSERTSDGNNCIRAWTVTGKCQMSSGKQDLTLKRPFSLIAEFTVPRSFPLKFIRKNNIELGAYIGSHCAKFGRGRKRPIRNKIGAA